MENLIPVMVSGNPAAYSGFRKLIGLNNPNFENNDISYSGFEGCSYFFSIKTDEKQTIYKLIKNGVRSYGASRGGSLIIAFSIPYGFKLEGGKTPYDVLCRFKDEFLKMGMTAQSDDVYQYAFDSQPAYTHILDNVVTEFSLVRETAVRHFPMKGSNFGHIIRPEEEIKKFFEDITYSEFAGYSEILVATQCSSPNYSSLNITIPRPKIYEVYVDGGLPKKVVNISEQILVTSSQDQRYYDNKQTNFTIAQLLKGVQVKGVRIDKILEKVYVSTKELEADERTELVDVDILPADKRGRIDIDKLILNSNGTRLNLQNGKIVLRGRGIDIRRQQSHITAYYQGEDLEAKWEGVRLVIYVKEKPKPQPAYPPYVNNGGQFHNISEPCVEITISLDREFFENETTDSKCLVRLEDGRKKDEWDFQRRVHFNETRNGCKGQFSVMKSQCDGVKLVIKGKKKILSLNKITLGNKQKLDFSQGDFEEQKKPTDSKVYLCLIIALVMFILGCAVGYFLHMNGNGNLSTTEIDGFLKETENGLKKGVLSFAQIDTLYREKYKPHKDEYKKRNNEGVCERIEAYYGLSVGIIEGDVDSIKNCRENLYDVHKKLIDKIVDTEESKARFVDKHSEIRKFGDIEGIYKYQCDECKKWFDNEEETKIKHKTIECEESIGNKIKCQKKFCTPSALEEHQKKDHEPPSKSTAGQFICPERGCRKSFATADELDRHQFDEQHGKYNNK